MAKIFKSISNIFFATLAGELLFRMKFSRFFIHILIIFFWVWMLIFSSLMIDKTLVRMERNRIELESLKIYHAQKTSELAGYDRLSTIDDMLRKSGSKVTFPEKPADRIQ